MIVSVDAKALEWLVCAYLSGDPVAHEEITNNVDQHTENQLRFGLPSRLIAKTFVFRLIYGGSAYSYANDPDFTSVSRSEKFWQKVIDEFYTKYTGVRDWHAALMREATTSGRVRAPTGRFFNYYSTLRNGDLVWPRTTVLNYIVQATAADLMSIARVSFFKRFKAAKFSGVIISTIHDSIVVDVPNEEVQQVCCLVEEVFRDIPLNYKRIFGVDFPLPTRCEVSYGPNKLDLTTYTGNGIIYT